MQKLQPHQKMMKMMNIYDELLPLLSLEEEVKEEEMLKVTYKLIDWFKLIFNYKIIDRFFEDDDDDDDELPTLL